MSRSAKNAVLSQKSAVRPDKFPYQQLVSSIFFTTLSQGECHARYFLIWKTRKQLLTIFLDGGLKNTDIS